VSGSIKGSSAPPGGAITPADELFLNLDGTIVNDSLQSWRIEVCGIHSHDSRNWVQLKLCGIDSFGVTLFADCLEACPIRRILAAWLPHLSCESPLIQSSPTQFAV
jgi:hypothetical protein